MSDEPTLFDRLLSAQKKIGVIAKDKTNPFFDSKYADINIILEMVKPILNDEGILLMQPLSNVDGQPAIKTILMHGTERIEDTTVFPDLPTPKEGKKSNPFQEMGSAVTYYRRYALISILGLQAIDDDGNAASTPTNEVKEKQLTGNANPDTEIPICSICKSPMKPQARNSNKFFCKHTDDRGKVTWGSPEFPSQRRISK